MFCESKSIIINTSNHLFKRKNQVLPIRSHKIQNYTSNNSTKKTAETKKIIKNSLNMTYDSNVDLSKSQIKNELLLGKMNKSTKNNTRSRILFDDKKQFNSHKLSYSKYNSIRKKQEKNDSSKCDFSFHNSQSRQNAALNSQYKKPVKDNKNNKLSFCDDSRNDASFNVMNLSQNRDCEKYLTFTITSNWGNLFNVSIGKIQLYDSCKRQIPIKSPSFSFSTCHKVRYFKGEKLRFKVFFGAKFNVESIEILNGVNDVGVKNLAVEDYRGKLVWKGIVPKLNLITNKNYVINLRERRKIKNNKSQKDMCLNLKEELNVKEIKKVYELCDRIKIYLRENNGNCKWIGLTGIELFDINDNNIKVSEQLSMLKTKKNNKGCKENKILMNLFNNDNQTINPDSMFLASGDNNYIEIWFKIPLKIKQILIYNYNYPLYLDISTKVIDLHFYYKNALISTYKDIYLFKGIGEEGVDFGQKVEFLSRKQCKNHIKLSRNLFTDRESKCKICFNCAFDYYTPILPVGNVIKFELVENFGSAGYIGLDKVVFYNEKNEEISVEKCKVFVCPGGYGVGYRNLPLVLSKYYNENSVLGNGEIVRVYFIFNEPICLHHISIFNHSINKEMSVKELKILLDDRIIFEGTLSSNEENIINFNENSPEFNKRRIDKEKEIYKNGVHILKLNNN